MTKKKIIRNFRRENRHFFRKKRNSEILVREKVFPSPPNSAPGLRHWRRPSPFSRLGTGPISGMVVAELQRVKTSYSRRSLSMDVGQGLNPRILFSTSSLKPCCKMVDSVHTQPGTSPQIIYDWMMWWRLWRVN